MAMHLVRRSGGEDDGRGKKDEAPPPSKTFEKMPALWEFLTASEWEEGETRETGTILIFVEEGRVKACLNDRDQGLVAFTSGVSVEDVFKSADKGLLADTLDWRPSRRGKGGRK